ncbi:phage tail protein I [Cupriavidus plantarum]|uniref:phage tail protein I n=1 Tax=Cupriavidus plantarum TaxID=942865 RepID=UPI000E25DFC9|nr:phage tail protein I [Cupriavidus plantarum]REE92637.1 phage tail P2-like protein [Cupriavidus plantarum]
MADLLPPNATTVERNVAKTGARVSDIPTPLRYLMRPDSIPLDQLPWLAWHLGIDAWKTYWPEQTRRARVRKAIPIARKNGTAAAVREVVATFGGNIALREWWQMNPRGIPGTFDLVLTLSGRDGEDVSAAFVEDVIAEIDRTKPVRAHYTVTQGVQKSMPIGVVLACRAAVYTRLSLSDS